MSKKNKKDIKEELIQEIDEEIEVYNADLANGLGNLTARVARLCEKVELNPVNEPKLIDEYKKLFDEFKLNEIIEDIWRQISVIDHEIDDAKPWKIEDLDKLKKLLQDWAARINQIAYELKPFLPETAEKIQKQFSGTKISSGNPLFPRIKVN